MSASDYYTSKAQIALLEAAADGDAKGMSQAVKAGADVNGVGRDGMLPLYWALANRSLKGMQWLLEHGADPNKRTTIPADWSWKKVKPSPIILAVSYPEYYPGTGHDMPYLKLLLEHGGNANQKTSYGRTLLFGVHNIEQARLLLEHGADVNHQDIDGETALVDTIQGGAYDIALLLLKAGADPTIKEDKHGYTAIDDIQAFGMYTPYKYRRQAYAKMIHLLQQRGYIPKSFEYDPEHPQRTWGKRKYGIGVSAKKVGSKWVPVYTPEGLNQYPDD